MDSSPVLLVLSVILFGGALIQAIAKGKAAGSISSKKLVILACVLFVVNVANEIIKQHREKAKAEFARQSASEQRALSLELKRTIDLLRSDSSETLGRMERMLKSLSPAAAGKLIEDAHHIESQLNSLAPCPGPCRKLKREHKSQFGALSLATPRLLSLERAMDRHRNRGLPFDIDVSELTIAHFATHTRA